MNDQISQNIKDLYEEFLLKIISKMEEEYGLPEIIMAQQAIVISLINMIPTEGCREIYWKENGNNFIKYLKEMSERKL